MEDTHESPWRLGGRLGEHRQGAERMKLGEERAHWDALEDRGAAPHVHRALPLARVEMTPYIHEGAAQPVAWQGTLPELPPQRRAEEHLAALAGRSQQLPEVLRGGQL